MALVTLILGLLLVAAVPRFQRTASRLQVERAAFAVAQWLRYAHELAVANNHAIIWVWRGNRSVTEVHEQVLSAGGLVQWVDRSPSRRLALPPAVMLTLAHAQAPVGCPAEVGADAECLRFYPDGTSEPATITVASPTHSYQATIDGTTSQVLLQAGLAAR